MGRVEPVPVAVSETGSARGAAPTGTGDAFRRIAALLPHFLLLLFLLFLLVLLPAPVESADGDGSDFSPPEGERALARYMAEVDGREFDVHAEPAPLLRKSVLARAHLKGSDFAGIRYLVHSNGKVEPYSLDAYVSALRDEGVGVAREPGGTEGLPPRRVAEGIVAADQPGAAILEGTGDIPSYCRRPVEADFRGVVRPPWFYEDEGTVRWIYYAWNREGGTVTRYRFTFRGTALVPPVTVLRIGEGVGEHLPAK